jgi:hypothetical protein
MGFLRGEILPKMRRGVRLKGLRYSDATNEDLFLGDLVAKNERENPFDGETTGDVAGLDPRVNWCSDLCSLRLLAMCATGRGVGRSISILAGDSLFSKPSGNGIMLNASSSCNCELGIGS